jgi:hypothetical protein
MRYAAVAVICIGVVLGLSWLFSVNDLAMFGFFAPKYEAVRRNTFEQSRAFNEGMQQELQQMRLDYIGGNDNQKAALKSTILHRVANYNLNMLSDSSLASFIEQLRSGS